MYWPSNVTCEPLSVLRRAGNQDAAEAHLRGLLDWNRMVAFDPGIILVLANSASSPNNAATPTGPACCTWKALPWQQKSATRAMALAVEGLAGAAGLAGNHTRAAVLLGSAESTRATAGAPSPRPNATTSTGSPPAPAKPRARPPSPEARTS
ncbi:hypothetical protein [Actinokineospora globicatena]|uniref:hypothetical protein n=1 Tax=Actinokineospora globicatena TaxID=103729 RepID=UPI0020A37C8A|nr:hypothetical protein [Actinokineospora globicatena]MCP2302952.1 hypothetical protein [Actinokineospora globicatena]